MSAVKETSGFLTMSDGDKIFYEHARTDTDKTLLCIPGALCSGRACYAYTLEHLSKDFNIVTFDPRGYGKSQETIRKFTPKILHEDAKDAAELMKQLGYEKYYVAGYSDGGTIGIILAGNNPSCVEKLIAIAANAYVSKEDLEMAEKQVSEETSEVEMAAMAAIFEMYGEEGFAKLYEQWAKNLRACFECPDGDICIAEAKAVTCPTLIIQGDQDECVARCHPDFLYETIQDSTLHIVPDEGHFMMYNKAEDLHQILKDFCDGNYSPPVADK